MLKPEADWLNSYLFLQILVFSRRHFTWEDTLFSIPQLSRKCKPKPVFFQLFVQQKQQKADNPMCMAMAQELMLVQSTWVFCWPRPEALVRKWFASKKNLLGKGHCKDPSPQTASVEEATFSFLQEKKWNRWTKWFGRNRKFYCWKGLEFRNFGLVACTHPSD